MLPQHFVSLDSLPLNDNGKVDRRRLPAPTASLGSAAPDFEAPCSAVEVFLAQTWQDALELQRVSRNDRFFEIGGHSLLCLQVTAQIEEKYGVHLNPRVLLRNNLAQVASQIEAARLTPAEGASAQSRVPKRSGFLQSVLRLGRLVDQE